MPDTRTGYEVKLFETEKTTLECNFIHISAALKYFINAKVQIDSFNCKASLTRTVSIT